MCVRACARVCRREAGGCLYKHGTARAGLTSHSFIRLHSDDRSCHTDRSGYWGPWTRAPTTFSNEYFRLLVEETWKPKKTHKGKKWTGPAQFETDGGALMMLPSDIAVIEDATFKGFVEMT